PPPACGTNLLRVGGYGRVATTALIKAVLLSNRYVKIQAYADAQCCVGRRLPAGAGVSAAARRANKCLLELGAGARRREKLGPLPELGLEDFVDVHTDPAHAAFVDLDLMQVRGRMRVPLGGAPVVLPKI